MRPLRLLNPLRGKGNPRTSFPWQNSLLTIYSHKNSDFPEDPKIPCFATWAMGDLQWKNSKHLTWKLEAQVATAGRGKKNPTGLPASPSAPRNQSSKALQNDEKWEGFGWFTSKILKFWKIDFETFSKSEVLHFIPDHIPSLRRSSRQVYRQDSPMLIPGAQLPPKYPNDAKCRKVRQVFHKNRPDTTTGVPCSFKAFARS